VTGDDLTSVPGLQEVHRRALVGKLGITSLRALADADQRGIYTALGGIRPRPSLTRIASWQDNARKRLSETTIDRSAWHTVASFAVIFAQRQVNGVWERRLEAEQTEMEPASEPRQWPGWDCGPLCDWMLGRLGLPEDEADSEAGAADQTGTAAATATEPSAGPRPARARRAELTIDSGVITDAVRELELIRAGDVIAERPEDLVQPVRLRLTVSGGRSGQQLRAAAWFRRPGGPGWSPHEPVIVPPSGQAEFDLSLVPAGGHDVRLLAWATAPGATLAAVTLPRLIFRQETEHDGDPAVVGA
jgi:hypothetical protein